MNSAPLAFTIADTRRMIGLGTTKIYEMIGSGQLDARKAGSRTLITAESIRQYFDSLPRAELRAGRAA